MSLPKHPNYKSSGHAWLTEIPADWRLVKLKHVCEVFPSNVDKHSREGETPVQLCNYTDVYHNDEVTASMEFMSATATPEQVAKFTLRKDDVIVTKDSETEDDIAIAAYAPQDLPGVVCGYHLSMIRPRHGVLGRFVKWFFDSTFLKAQANVAATGLTRVGLSQYDLDNVALPLPPLRQQKAIADFLDSEIKKIDALVQEQTRLLELLAEKTAAEMLRLVSKGIAGSKSLKPSGLDWAGDVPQHWTVQPIRSVARLESGHTPSRSRPDWWVDCTTPWFALSDVWQIRDGKRDYVEETSEKISELGLANSSARLLPAGTVILSRTASVGFSGIMKVPMATTQDFANWVCGERLLPEYLLFALRSMRSEFERLMVGSTHNTIYMPDIRALRIPLPPVSEQEEIVARIKEVRARLESLAVDARRSTELLLARRGALISAAVTGRIQIPVRMAAEGGSGEDALMEEAA